MCIAGTLLNNHIASNVYKNFLQYSWYEIYICIRQEANILVWLLPKAKKAPKDITVYWDQVALTWILF